MGIFVFSLMTSLYQLLYDIGSRMSIIDKNYTIVTKPQDTVLSIVFVITNIVLLNGLQDIIFI